jgi:hypothetical protein
MIQPARERAERYVYAKTGQSFYKILTTGRGFFAYFF